MGRADPIGALGWIAWPLLGAAAGAAATLALNGNPRLGIVAMGAICALPLALVLGVRWAVPAALAILVAMEEFPSGLGDLGEEGVQRSMRTPFYSVSIGIGGLYPPDVLVLGAVALLAAHGVLQKRRGLLRLDGIGWALVAMVAMLALSSVLSLANGTSFVAILLQEDATTPTNADEKALAWIGMFQVKTYVMMLAGYLAALMHTDRRSRLDGMVTGVLAGILALYAFGIVRAMLKPSIIARATPLYYDSPSSLLFALVIFYTVAGWAFGIHSWRRTLALAAASGLAALFILVSYRRTMWGGMALAGLVVLAVLPRRAQVRLAVWGMATAAIAGAGVMATPLGAMLLEQIAGRISATGVQDTSTLYRLALFVHFIRQGGDIPAFGYGLAPLWAKYIYFGYLRFNLENVHSLYFWLYLRTGPVGFAVAAAGWLFIFARLLGIFLAARDAAFKTLAICLFAALLMFLFSGIFNPVYAQSRYMMPMGIALGMAARLGQMSRLQRRQQELA